MLVWNDPNNALLLYYQICRDPVSVLQLNDNSSWKAFQEFVHTEIIDEMKAHRLTYLHSANQKFCERNPSPQDLSGRM